MPSYTPPTKDMQFILHEMLNITGSDIPGYDELEADFTSAILDEAGKLTSEVLAPLNVVGDKEGCRLENGVVYTPTGFKDAFEQVKEGGWPGLDMPEEFGGQNMPYVIGTAVGEMFSSANMAFTMYQGLTHGAASARRFLSLLANTTWPTTSFTWCWPRSKVAPKASRACHCSLSRSSS